jgi:hypothetical protein
LGCSGLAQAPTTEERDPQIINLGWIDLDDEDQQKDECSA